jgi:predicted small metal-binding protein
MEEPVGVDPRYTVTDDGRVRGPSGKWLVQKVGRYGHRSVDVGGRWFSVHRLVALAFIGPCPEGHEIAHENGDATDNRVMNLSWKTHADNIRDRTRHGRTASRERHGMAKLTEDQVRDIRSRYKGRGLGCKASNGGPSQRSLAEEYGVTEECVWRIIKRKTWASIPE